MKTCGACGATVGWPDIDWHPHLCGACGALQDAVAEDRRPPQIGGYEVVRWIGGGGMGEVWLARELALDRFVSLKIVRHERISEEGLVRFRREAELSARLQHPSILQVFKFGTSGQVVYYTMPYVPGPSLELARQWTTATPERGALWLELLGRTASPGLPTTPEDAGLLAAGDDAVMRTIHLLCERFAELATGLHAVHTAGAVHRDIKPGNILIAPDGRLKLTDFGLAQVEGRAQITATGALTGTPSFMSPEQVMSHVMTVDHRTDIYSLALTLYCCLVDQHPFQAKDLRELFKKITMSMPPRPCRLRPGFPPDLEAILLHALAKNPADRYSSAKELASDLVRFTHFEPIVARPVPFRSHLRLFLLRHRAVAKAVCFAVAALFMIVAVVVLRDTQTAMAKTHEAHEVLSGIRVRVDRALADAAWSLARTESGAVPDNDADDAAVLAELDALRVEIEKAAALDPLSAEARDEFATVQVHRNLLGSELAWRSGNRARASALLQHAVEAAHGRQHLEGQCRRVAARRCLTYEGPGGASTACLVRSNGGEEARIELRQGRNDLPPAGTWTLVVTDDSAAVLRAPVRVLGQTSIEQKIQVPLSPGVVHERFPGMVLIPGGITECGCPVAWSQSAFRPARSRGSHSQRGVPTTDAAMFRWQRFVHVDPFLVAELEVTNGEYLAFLEATEDYQRAMSAARLALPDMAARAARIAPYPLGWGSSKPEGRQLDFPVTGVSVVEALAYAIWKGGRLPTSDEWEKGARGVDGAAYPWGSEFKRTHSKELAAIWPVGTRDSDRSPYGVRDVVGNAAEWVNDPVNSWVFDADELGALGDSLAMAGDADGALDAFQRARDADPFDDRWHDRIAMITEGRLHDIARAAPASGPARAERKREWAVLRGTRAVPAVPWRMVPVLYGSGTTDESGSGLRIVIDCRRRS